MGLSTGQRRSEQLWWTEDLIDDLINEKCPGFSRKHDTYDLVKQFEPEILTELNHIADKVIESVKGK